MNSLITLMFVISIAYSMLAISGASGQESHIPLWLKNNAKWWTQGEITDGEFANTIQYLQQKGLVRIPAQSLTDTQTQVWAKNNAKDWANGQESDIDFTKTLQYVIQNRTTADTIALASTQEILSDQNLLAMAGNKYADGNVQLGDGKYTTTEPKKGFIYLCHVPQMGQGASGTGTWISGNIWNLMAKPSVSGSVSWPNAVFSNTVSGNTRTLSGNDLPVGNTTGAFPISPNDAISKYDQNPNSISAQTFSDQLPANPTYSDVPYCMGGEVGIMLTGVPLFNAFDAELRDAPAHEGQDSCNGHPQNTGIYHYHSLSSCFKNANEKTILGYALDGFPITGPKITADKYLTTDDLDECHGITSEIIENGLPLMTYHYVMTYDFPYSASCFRGKPAEYTVIGSGQGTNQHGPSQGPTHGAGQNGQHPAPPQEAISACSTKPVESSCSFTSPQGDVISGTCQVPPGGSLACVPH